MGEKMDENKDEHDPRTCPDCRRRAQEVGRAMEKLAQTVDELRNEMDDGSILFALNTAQYIISNALSMQVGYENVEQILLASEIHARRLLEMASKSIPYVA